MRLLKRLLVGLCALLILSMLVLYLTPLDAYVPEMERALSARLKVPVSIASLRSAMLPWPHLELRDVLLGGQDGIALHSVEVSPALPDLLAGRLAMDVKVRDGAMHWAQLSRLADAFSDRSVGGQGLAVRELWLSDLILLAPGMAIAPMEGKLEFAEAGALQRVWLALDEQRLTAVLTPLQDRHFSVEVRAKGWVAPQFSKLPIDELQLDGVLGRDGLAAQRFFAVSQGLRVEGAGRLNFSNGVDIHVQLRRIEVPLEHLMVLLGRPVALTGLLFAKGRLDCRADSWREWVEEAHFVGDMRMTDVVARVSESFRQPLAVGAIWTHVEWHPKRLDLSALRAELYGGSLSGDVHMDRRMSVLGARLAMRDINMRPLVEALTDEVLFTGRMESQAKLSMNLDRLDRFPENLKLAGKFHLRDGTLSKVDLAKAVGNSGMGGGGVTRFSDLTGSLKVDASGYHFGELRISSGSLNAAGRIDMTPALQLNGVLEVDVKGTAGLVGMPLVVSGTLEHPEVGVSGAALAGAAVGTAVLGPGLGTALGVKLGGFMNKLLGMEKSANRAQSGLRATR